MDVASRGQRPARLTIATSLVVASFLVSGCQSDQTSSVDERHTRSAEPFEPSTADLLRDCSAIRDSSHPQLGSIPFEAIEKEIARFAGGPVVLPADDLELYLTAAALALDQAEFQSSLEYLDRAADLVANSPQIAEQRDRVEYQRAVLELRLGEEANCSGEDVHARCIFVPGPEGGFVDGELVERAIERLGKILDRHPGDLRARWLLNLAHMNLRSYPDEVPRDWLVEPAFVGSSERVPRFGEIGHLLGVDLSSLLGGAIMDDFDGDGLLDLFVTSYDPCEPVRLFHNDGRGGLVDTTRSAGLLGQLGGFNAQQTDFDNDGHLDIFITRGGWQGRYGRQRNSLLRNSGAGIFVDVTVEAGLATPAFPTQASAWADFDGDGDLDLYIGNEIDGEDPREPTGAIVFPGQLFRNNANGSFTDIADRAGVTNDRMAKGVAWGDIDNDGRPDLYVSNLGANRLYSNQGDGTFRDIAVERGVAEPIGRSFATWFWDYDNDGALDIFCAGYSARLEQVVAGYLGESAGGEMLRLYRNRGDGFFDDVTVEVGLDRILLPMGANFGDIDNDGWLDIYLGTGAPAFDMQMPNVMLWNDRGIGFADVTIPTQTGHLPKGHGVAFGDIDNDFDQDILLQAGGFVPGDRQPNAFFVNPGSGGKGIAFDLVGVSSNRSAIGARVELVFSDPSGAERSIHRVVGSGSSFGANSLRVEVGIGEASVVRSVRVQWPTAGSEQVFENVSAEGTYEVVEGRDTLRRLELGRVELERDR